jgi:hypothetical protein
MSAPSEPDPDEQLSPIDLLEIKLPDADVSAACGGVQGGGFSAFLS